MKIEMICTGEEVLSGQIVDTNAAWFANELMERGIEMQRRITVGDRMEDLVSTFIERSFHADVILVNGGLGPTSDDMSAQAMAQAKGEPLVENAIWRERIEAYYKKANRVMNSSNLKQALLPKSAIMVDNPVGTACGFRVKLNRAWLFFTPGVPMELKEMVHNQFFPFLMETFPQVEPTRLVKLLTFGVGESHLANDLEALSVPEGITIGYRSSLPHVEIKLFARGQNAIEQLDEFVGEVKAAIGYAIVSERFPSLAQEVHTLFTEQANPLTVSFAESCTGGMISSQLTDFSGSSRYLYQGLVTYSNESKMKLLGVKESTLNEAGAVSEACVKEMAIGARELLDTDFAVSVSGVAGPSGGTEDKPVGTVAFALASKEDCWQQMLYMPFKSREAIRKVSSAVALDMLRRALLNQNPVAEYNFFRRNSQR